MNLRPWTPAEDRVLLDQYGQTATLAEMAESLRRGRNAVWFRAKELGLSELSRAQGAIVRPNSRRSPPVPQSRRDDSM